MPQDTRQALIEKLNNRTARVAVVGMGYVGLPLAVVFNEAGFTVTGIDLDARKVDLLNRAESYILDVPTAQVAEFVNQGKLKATTDYSVVRIWMPFRSVCQRRYVRRATRTYPLLSVPLKGSRLICTRA